MRPTLRPWRLLLTLPLVLSLAATACGSSPPPTTLPARIDHLEGKVLERLDAPPYSFLRVETVEGERWVGVPIATYPREAVVRVQGAVLLRNQRLPALNRTLEAVHFGRLVTP